MKKAFRKAYALLAAAALVGALAGCTPTAEERAALEKFCTENNIQDCHIFIKEEARNNDSKAGTSPDTPVTTPAFPDEHQPGVPASSPPKTPDTKSGSQPQADAPVTVQPVPPISGVTFTAVAPTEAPPELRNWMSANQGSETAGGSAVTSGEYTYVVVSGGMQPTGGYRVEVVSVTKENGTWIVQAKLFPPAPGSIVTMAMTNPTAYYRLSKLDGPVRVQVATPGGSEGGSEGSVSVPAPVPGAQVTVMIAWVEPGMIQVTGQATVSDLNFMVRVSGSVVARADAQVKDGRYIANVIVDGGPKAGMELVISNPENGQVLTTVPISPRVDR